MTNKSELDAVLERAYTNLYQALVSQHAHLLGGLVVDFLKIREADPDKIRSVWEAWPSKSTMGRFEYRQNASKRNLVSPLMVRDAGQEYAPHPRYVFATDCEARIQALALKFADAQLASYKAKLNHKLHEIWGAKEIQEIKFAGSLDYHHISFTFTDGSCFVVQNAVVHHVNSHGTWYAQFPSTFHNVRLANGGTIKTPSEAKMKKLFAAKQEAA